MNEFFIRTNRISWHRSVVGGFCSSRRFKNSSQAVMPSSWGMFIYSKETSRVNKRQVRGSLGNLHICLWNPWYPGCDGSGLRSAVEINQRSVRCFLSGHHWRQRWVYLGFQAYEFSGGDRIWLLIDVGELGSLSPFYLSALFYTIKSTHCLTSVVYRDVGSAESFR